jgi:outer membrane receptor for ferrienterochelin and colicins
MKMPVFIHNSPAPKLLACLIPLFCGLLINSPVIAQDPDDSLTLLYGDEETVSIATGTKKPLRLAPSVASVITAEDIRAMGAQSLDEVLQAVPGVHVSLGVRYSSLISIRGIHTKFNPQVLMLINGYPITELYSGSRAPTFRIPVNNIDRVEVIRGPGSAVYGADAFAGVINIITKDVRSLPDFEIGVIGGSFETYGGWIQTSTEWSGWDVGLSIELLHSNDDEDRIIRSDLQSGLDAVFGTHASLAPDPAATNYDIINTRVQLARAHWQLSLNSWKQDKGGIGAGIAEALDPYGYQNVEQHLFEFGYNSENLFDNWQFTGKYNYLYLKQQSHYTILPPGTTLPIGSDGNLNFATAPANFVMFTDGLLGNPGGEDKNSAFEFAAFYSGLPMHRIRFAGGYKTQTLETFEAKNFGPGIIDGSISVIDGTLTDVTDTPFIYMPDKNRNIKHLSIQDEWSLYNDWELTIGVRYDDYSDFGSTVNPRLALVWQTTYKLTSKLLYGRAFRAPSLSEQFAINNPVTLGNPDVDPEKIDTVELSFEYRPSYDVRTKLTAFRYNIDGLIDYADSDSLPGGGSIAQNIHDQEGYGLEFEAAWQVSDTLSLAGNYSWQNSENKATGRAIADAPQQLAYVDVRWQLSPAWTWGVQLHRVADRERSWGDSRDNIDDYTLVNANVYSRQLLPFMDVNFSIRNLFDEDAREPSTGPVPSIPSDHPLEGRRYLFEVVFRLPN